MNKKLTVFDTNDGAKMLKDRASVRGTEIILKEMGSGKVLFRGHNKVLVSGSEFNALKDFTFDDFVEDENFLKSIPSYDEAFNNYGRPFTPSGTTAMPLELGDFKGSNFGFYVGDADTDSVLSIFKSVNDISDDAMHKLYRYFTRRVCLWCVGIDGCGLEASRVFKVHNTKWIAPYGYADYNDGTGGNNTYDEVETCLIPFKYRTVDADLSDTYRETYFGRSQDSTKSIGYFFKTFDEPPVLIRRYADDSTDLAQVYDESAGLDVWKDNRASEGEVVVQLKMSVSNSDCREYFGKTVGVNDSKINTISLCTAVPYLNANNKLEYADIRPFTKFNFPNEALIDYSKGIDITYYLYY